MIDEKGKFTIIRGADLDFTVTYYQPDGVTPVDLTNKDAVTRIAESRVSSDVIELSTDNGGMELGGVAGTIRWIMPKESTSFIQYENGIYDCFLAGEPLLFDKPAVFPERV